MDRAALCAVAVSLGRTRGVLDALEAAVAGAVDGLGDDGPGASVVLRSSSRCSQREADRRAKRAAGLAVMPNTTEALRSGRITAEHADALVKAAEETSAEAVDRSELVGHAASRPADLAAREAREWTRRHRDDHETQSRHECQRGRRRLFIFRGDGDMVIIHGEFDPVTGAEIEAMIEAETNRMFHTDGGRGVAGGVRSTEQRRADALAVLLRGGHLIDGTTVDTVDVRAWRPSPRHQMMIVADAAVVTGDDPGGRREIIGGAAIPTSVLDRLACNSELFGLVFSGDGQPLWHGRGVRMVTDAQLRGLMLRDQGCVICDKSPRWCEAHHVIAWQGPGRGPTDIDNLVLICSHHHHLVHDHRWRLVRSSTGHWRMEPPDIGPPPAGRDP